jgi:ribonucleoside-diphosphate reductase alpha chain
VRFLDNVIDVSGYPLPAQRKEAKAKRRIGLGITGLGNALAMCGVRYGSDEARRLAGRWMAVIERNAYLASARLAAEKGTFPLFEASPMLASPNIVRLDEDVRREIAKSGLRNGCLTSIAPTGTISLLAGNVSSGIEPVFDFHYLRRVREAGDRVREETVEDYAYRLYRAKVGPEGPLPPAFVATGQLTPREHLVMQAAVQAHVDSSISKTINCPEDMSFEAFASVYAEAYDLGLKGCTTFRPNPVTGSVLAAPPQVAQASSVSAITAAELGVPAAGRVPLAPDQQITVEALASPAEIEEAAPRREAAYGPAMEALLAPAAPVGASRPADRSGVVYMARPLEREPVLAGFTYKLKWAGSDHAIYVTINDIERDGRRRPFEIFINTKNLEHYAWTVALTRMISAVFRRGGDVSFVVEELKAVFDPQGGQWMDGRYVPSLLAAIGNIIESHLLRTGFLQHPLAAGIEAAADGGLNPPGAPRLAGRRCPRCYVGALVSQSGCLVCRDCGYSRCG